MSDVDQVDSGPPTDDELPGLADDVGYEVVMVDRAFRWASAWPMVMERRGGLTNDEADRRNADIEVFLLHVRNLTDFFVSRPSARSVGKERVVLDDVVAHHYVPTWTQVDGGEALSRLVEHKPWMNKRVQHLTAARQRVSAEETERLLVDVYNDVMELVGMFLNRLSAERRAWFQPG